MPIPKNLVLIALLEAAQQTVMAEKRQDEGYESGDDDEQVVAGMNLLSSDFGTYVVREKDGLVVQPLSPLSYSLMKMFKLLLMMAPDCSRPEHVCQ